MESFFFTLESVRFFFKKSLVTEFIFFLFSKKIELNLFFPDDVLDHYFLALKITKEQIGPVPVHFLSFSSLKSFIIKRPKNICHSFCFRIYSVGTDFARKEQRKILHGLSS